MKTFNIWVERSDITRELFEIEAETLKEAQEIAEAGEGGERIDSKHMYGEVLDSWEGEGR